MFFQSEVINLESVALSTQANLQLTLGGGHFCHPHLQKVNINNLDTYWGIVVRGCLAKLCFPILNT